MDKSKSAAVVSKSEPKSISKNDSKEDETDDEDGELEAGGALPVDVEIEDRLSDLLQDPVIRTAVGSGVVTVDGKISTSKTRQKLKAWIEEIKFPTYEKSHLRLITFLNSVWMAGCDSLTPEFWWTHKNMLLKMVHVCLIGEACNQLQYGAKPNVKNLPHCAMFIYDYITSLGDDAFDDLEEDFREITKTHDEFTQMFLRTFGDDSDDSKKVESKSEKKKSSKK